MRDATSNLQFRSAQVGTTVSRIAEAEQWRRSILIQNVDATGKAFVGKDNTVTTANGLRLQDAEAVELVGYMGEVWAIADTADTDVRIVEIGSQ